VDREAIERRDFPVGRRGYDQAAVDEHLRRVADEFEATTRRVPSPSTLAAGASEQVRVILEAAEASACELRADAARQSADQVARVQSAAGGMLDRIDELERELGNLLAALRASGERLTLGLERLHDQTGELGTTSEPPEEDFAAAAPAPGAEPPQAPSPNGDEAGARLIALNMALSGTPRDETARYLAERFELPDAEALLDDVYERAGR
jgi:DivIVA domain-containing protein